MPNLILPGEDVADIARSIALGDPTVGWRGDETMAAYAYGNEIGVYAFDAHGTRYLAAVVTYVNNPGWRHELLARLRDGDWRNGSAFERIEAANAKVRKENERLEDEKTEEFAEKFAWALKKDTGHLHSGTTRDFY